MKIVRFVLTLLLMVGLTQPARAGDLQKSIAKAVQQQADSGSGSRSKAYMWPGAALVIGGMAVAMYGFIQPQHRGEGDYQPNPALGAAGLSAAALGGLLLMVGAHRADRSPTVTFGRG